MKLRARSRTVKAPTVKVITISVPPDLLARSKMKAQLSGYRFSFSGYVSRLLENDLTWATTQK